MNQDEIILLKQQRHKYALQYEREKTALKFYCLGKGYHDAIKALGFIERLEFRIPPEERFRKDKLTPSLHHQIRVALAITQLPDLTPEVEERCIVNSLLHDCQEDHSISTEEIRVIFGERAADSNWRLTKKFAGENKDKDVYIRDIALDLVAALCKGTDRNDNLSTMIDVFTIDKMEQYATEAEDLFLPMLKAASKLFPEFTQAFQVISQKMKLQIGFTRKYVKMARDLENMRDTVEFTTAKLKEREADYQELEEDALKQIAELKATKSLDKKTIFREIASTLRHAMEKRGFLELQQVSTLLTDVTQSLELSALEITEFLDDQLSDGTTILRF